MTDEQLAAAERRLRRAKGGLRAGDKTPPWMVDQERLLNEVNALRELADQQIEENELLRDVIKKAKEIVDA